MGRETEDANLHEFNNGIALLLDDGEVAGYLATVVDQFRTPFRLLTPQGRVWWLVTWSDGSRERIEEDYPPWTLVDEVRQGHADLDFGSGPGRRFQVEWLHGAARDEAWSRYGILDEVGAYM